MTIRKEFYSRRNVLYIPRDPMSRGDVPENYHIFGANDRIGVSLFYECEKSDKKVNLFIYLILKKYNKNTFFYSIS